jgi:hypothetical protein
MKSDDQFCAEYGAAYAEITSAFCANGVYTGAVNGEFCQHLEGDFIEICADYQSCSQAGDACNRLDLEVPDHQQLTTTSSGITVSTTEATTTEADQSCVKQFPSTIIQADNTIRMLDPSRKDHCAFKKYASYKAGQEVWYKKCDAGNANANKAGKYQWTFDSATGLVQSKGAADQGKSFCFGIQSLSRFGKQRVKIQTCDANDQLQQFEVINGRLHAKNQKRICLGPEEYKIAAAEASNNKDGVALTFQDCYPSTWGDGACSQSLVGADQTIRPFALDSDSCLFKKFTGYNNGDEIWLKSCADSSHSNANKAGKFQWSYDAATGLITSEGSKIKDVGNVYCMKINNSNRFYKQRVKLAKCDANDPLQQFDFINGKLYAKSNHRLCAGYEYDKMAASSETAFIFSTCFPNAFAIDLNSMA